MDAALAHPSPALVLTLAIALDLAFGEPPAAVHPVVWIGWAARPLLALRERAPGPATAFVFGTLWSCLLAGGAALACAALLVALAPHPWLSWPVQVFLVGSCFALRALLAAGRRLESALEADDLPAARAAVGHLCSRDPSELSGPALASAGIESLSENTHDSVVAPLFFYALGGLPALVFYRVFNTLDAMVGYRDDREWLGKTPARIDDVLNYLPARVSAVLLALSGNGAKALVRQDTWRNASTPPGPNSGWPMAVAAATLGVRLEKPGGYVLGALRSPPSACHLTAARHLVRRAALTWMGCVVALLAWRGGPLVWLWHP